MMVPFLLSLSVLMTACGERLIPNPGVQIEKPRPEPGPVTAKKVARLLLRYDAALDKCNAQLSPATVETKTPKGFLTLFKGD